MDFYGKMAAQAWGAQQPFPADLNGLTSIANQQAAAASSLQNIVGTPFPFSGAQQPLQQQPAASQKAHGGAHRTPLSKAGTDASSKKQGKQGEGSRRKWAPNRKAAGFWSPFNDWWRCEYEKLGRRPSTEEVSAWYVSNADTAWKGDKPSVKETRRHAKCLRTTADVRNYFRKYRAKRSVQQGKKLVAAKIKKTAQQMDNSMKVFKSQVGGGHPAEVAMAPNGAAVIPYEAIPSAKFNPAAWMAQQGAAGVLGQAGAAAKIGAFAPQNDMFSAMYRNYAQAAQAQATPFAFVQNPTQLLYQNSVNLGARSALAQPAPSVALTAYPNRGSSGGVVGGVKRETTGSPNSTETTEPMERPGSSQPQLPFEQVAAQNAAVSQPQSDAACLSSMISHIERSRSLANTPTPIPWRNEEVSTPFQDDNNLEMQNIKLDYEPTVAHSIHILPPAVVDSAESNGDYIDGL